MVEFALVLPLLLVVLLGMLDFGKAFNYWQDSTHISAEGARYAAVNRKPDPGSADSLQQQLRDQVDSNELHEGSNSVTPAEICISFPNGSSNPGDPVEVSMSFEYHWLGFLTTYGGGPELADKTVVSRSTMRLEAIPTNYSAGCA